MSKDLAVCDIAHLRKKLANINDQSSPEAVVLAKQIEILEDAVIIYRLGQAESKQMFVVDTSKSQNDPC